MLNNNGYDDRFTSASYVAIPKPSPPKSKDNKTLQRDRKIFRLRISKFWESVSWYVPGLCIILYILSVYS
jgi:hypothetical protein